MDGSPDIKYMNKNSRNDNLQVDIPSYIFSNSHRLRERCRNVVFLIMQLIFLIVKVPVEHIFKVGIPEDVHNCSQDISLFVVYYMYRVSGLRSLPTLLYVYW